MAIHKERIHYLLDVFIAQQANQKEERELMRWILEADEDSELKSYVLKVWQEYRPSLDSSCVDWKEMYANVIAATPPKTSKVRRLSWRTAAAAGVLLIALGLAAYIYFVPHSQTEIAMHKDSGADVNPVSSGAVLTLSDGARVDLEANRQDTIASQGNMQIIRESDGIISYVGTPEGDGFFNALSVPRGSKPFSLYLADGSKVWLNVGSEIKYPTAFTGTERAVEITGEAYFEVQHNEARPFVVRHNEVSVHVLGTSFNVNTYQDEPFERITLIEGRVSINRNNTIQTLKPGQQVSFAHNQVGEMTVTENVILEDVLSWRKKQFNFSENTDIDAIMRQLSRWYGVDVVFHGEVDKHFWGSISGDLPLSDVLKILEATGGVKFKMNKNKIVVMPAST